MRNCGVIRANPAVDRVLAAAALLLSVLASPCGTMGATHHVREGHSIAAVLAMAAPGDTVRIAAATFGENLVITVPVVLTGPEGPTAQTGPADPAGHVRSVISGGASPADFTSRAIPLIRGGYLSNVVHVLAAGTVLDGLHISEAGPHLTKDLACVLVEADSVTVRNCLITESLHGIYVKGGNGTVITGNRVEGRLDLIEADRGNGIHLWNSRGNLISGNEILHARDGIYFSFAHETHIADNHIHHVRYGLHYMYSNHNSFTDNLFELNVAGAALMYSEDISFTRNTFARCRGFRAYGILYQSMANVTAQSNLVLDNSRGIFMNNSNGNLLEFNDVVDNDLAVQLNGGCDDNAFLRNNFINNLSELLLDVSDRQTQWADATGGNYWSRYTGYDLDRDGIGDVPFSIQNVFQIMESRAPEVRFYLLSPAAKILELAEQTLPILNLGDVQDPRPLIEPAQNRDVPWAAIGAMDMRASRLGAGLYLAGTVVPFIVLLRSSRRRGRSRR